MVMFIEPREESWQTVRAWAGAELATLRSTLERPNVEWERVIAIRAEIRRLRELLALPEEIKHGRTTVERPD